MIRNLMIGSGLIEDTLALWASLSRTVRQRIRPVFTQGRVAASAGQFLDGLVGNEPGKTARGVTEGMFEAPSLSNNALGPDAQFCPPDGATINQTRKVVIKYIDDRPEQ